MRLQRLACFLLTTVLLVAVSGCASDNVVFLTKTSFGIDVSSEPAGVNIGYDRFEGYVGPRFDSGAVPPVAASFETNGKLFDRAIRQVYATGEAARVVTSAGKAASAPDMKGTHKVMIFSTGTALGLKLGFGSTGATDMFTLGYKRREASVIPITNGTFSAVVATLQNDVSAGSRADTEFGVQQYFATGEAAVSVAGLREVKGLFMRRFEALDQSRGALSAASCLAALPDADLPRVWANGETNKLLGGPTAAAALRGKPTAEARAIYISTIATPDENNRQWTSSLEKHQNFVCALAGR
ncbi:hypothetical protein J7E70_13035 [Variovorax paradoxus]|nr:hypothetical protein [Variovorax paradoxus]MBT2301387.1 hypothetical protein [Variovorax paradoxus]